MIDDTTRQQVKEKVALLPDSPGVYQFLNAEGTIIYVGKAKNLKRRVSSYFVSRADHTRKVQVMVRQIADLRHIVVGSEADALLLENNLIKELQPRYNILLKDSKSYPWIVVKNEPFPRIFSTRKFVKDGSSYFGPYSSVTMQRAVLELIRGLYPLRTCKLNLSPQAIAKGTYSVCLEYHIGNCLGPCVGQLSEKAYADYIASAKNILRGDLRPAQEYFTAEMKRLAAGLHFEQAAQVKEKLELLSNYSSRSVIVSATLTNLEVVYVLNDEGASFCNHMRIVHGAVVHSFTFEMRGRLDETPDELLAAMKEDIRAKREIITALAFYISKRVELNFAKLKMNRVAISLYDVVKTTGEVKDVLLLDVMPLSLGIETLGGVFTRLIDRNTTIPVKKSQVFSTAADNQTSVEIHILQGEREFCRDNKTMGRFMLTGIAPAPRGIPQIEVTFDVDANGIVHVEAKDLGTGKSTDITITSSTNLSEDEINKAVKEAEQYAEEDKKRKKKVDSRNKLDGLIFSVEQTMKEGGDKLAEEDKQTLQEAVDEAKKELDSDDEDRFNAAYEALSNKIQPIFQKMYQQNAGAQGAAPDGDGAGDEEFHQ